MIKRRRSRQIRVGNIRIGGNAPIPVQSMTKSVTEDVEKVVKEIKRLEDAGCEIVRLAVKTSDDAEAIRKIKRKVKIPIVCDIHFNYALALKAIGNGADKVRLNPGNIRNDNEIKQVVRAAKKADIPIRIGLNSGSVKSATKKDGSARHSDIDSLMVRSALGYVKLFEESDFRDIIISLKASDVVTTIDAYRKIAGMCDYPLHLGVTATGAHDVGVIKSSIGIGSLLVDGIGDTIRVSLTADPAEEILAGRRILSSLGLRRFGPEVISCPTCGRCQVDLVGMVNELEGRLSEIRCIPEAKMGRTIAVMGCEVNGPGEARDADIGIAFGSDSGALFKKGKIVKKVKAVEAVKYLLKLIKE